MKNSNARAKVSRSRAAEMKMPSWAGSPWIAGKLHHAVADGFVGELRGVSAGEMRVRSEAPRWVSERAAGGLPESGRASGTK